MRRRPRAARLSGIPAPRLIRLALLAVLGAALCAPVPAGAAAPRARTFKWSGVRWTVRAPKGREMPGNNRWDDTRNNVRVRHDGTLRLGIDRGRSVEVTGPPSGYGRYRWVVKSDLSRVDPFRVIAFFVSGTTGEQDFEFSRWADPNLPQVGSWVTWRNNVERLENGPFTVTAKTPYTIGIDRGRATTRFWVRDGAGTMLVDAKAPSIGDGRRTAPRMSYWLYPGQGTRLSPFTNATVHPPVILRSFRYRRQ